MTLDLDDLERVASAATPGPWRVEGLIKRGGMIAKIISHGMNERGDGPAGYVGDTYGVADAEFVAALNPAVCLALLARARDAERLGAVMRSVHETLSQSSDDLADDARLTIEFALMVPEPLSALKGGPANG